MMAKRKSREQQLAEKIADALHHGRFLPKAGAREAAFHLTDWLSDLAELDELLHTPTQDAEGLQKALLGFISHAPAHLAAAHRIVMGSPVTDVFEIGAVKGSGRAKRKPGAAYRNNGHHPRTGE